jgi:hypothetical protein
LPAHEDLPPESDPGRCQVLPGGTYNPCIADDQCYAGLEFLRRVPPSGNHLSPSDPFTTPDHYTRHLLVGGSFKTRRVMIIGTPLIGFLTVDELRAGIGAGQDFPRGAGGRAMPIWRV